MRSYLKELHSAFIEINYAANWTVLTAKTADIDDGQSLNTPNHWLMSMPVNKEAIFVLVQNLAQNEIRFQLVGLGIRVDAVHVILSHPVTQQKRSFWGLERSSFRHVFQPPTGRLVERR